jgi:hypothetical protein
MMQRPRHQTITCESGLDLESNPTKINPGGMIACKNFHAKNGGGYTRVGGYERYDGQASPYASEDPETARAAITAVPGEDGVLGVWIFDGNVYAFRNATGGASAKMYKSTVSGWSEVTTGVTLDPDGRYEFDNYNFFAASALKRMYGVDGVNKAFMFDGTTFTQLSVDGETVKPEHLRCHSNHLFLTYPQGQWVHSGIGDPQKWNATTEGAGAGGTGDDIVGLRSTVGGALAIFMRNRVSMLYGSSQADWQSSDLRQQSEESGAYPFTMQSIGNDIVYLDDRGLTSIQQAQTFGNFNSSTIDQQIKEFILFRKSHAVASCLNRSQSQYWLFFDHDSGTEVLTLTFGSNGLQGYGRLIYPFTTNCVCSSEDGDGNEMILVGATDGFVYRLEVGDSFDGEEIEAYFKLAYHHYGSPELRKRFRQALFGMASDGSFSISVKPEFGYGSTKISTHRKVDADMNGGGGIWDVSKWGEFVWSAQSVDEAIIDITGTEKNMSLHVYSKGVTLPYTVHDVTVQYSLRRIIR